MKIINLHYILSFLLTLSIGMLLTGCKEYVTEAVPVSYVTLDSSYMELLVGESRLLMAVVSPSNAHNQKVIWVTSNSSVASVNDGRIFALKEGSATITAKTDDGGRTAECNVRVFSLKESIDYVDEYGINHGSGIVLADIVWAPVNCGYHETDFKYGKLYQWGRKYGQGYSGKLYDINCSSNGNYSDASVPLIEDGARSVTVVSGKDKENVFYTSTIEYELDWADPQNDNLWNSGTESNPKKTEYDPCPKGWRVPTYAEFDKLIKIYSSWKEDEEGRIGCRFARFSADIPNAPQVFLPACGYRDEKTGNATNRGFIGNYWSSIPSGHNAKFLNFSSNGKIIVDDGRANGYSIRCVAE